MSDGPVDERELRARLDRVAAYEAGIRPTLLNRLLRRVGPTRPFAEVYRRIGPRIDPWLNERTGGKVSSRLYGFPALVLVTTGARTGARRVSPLLYVRDGDDFVVVGTNFGTEHHPGWTYNLAAHPEAEVEVGEERVPVVAARADAESFERLWPALLAIYPGYATYRERLEREARMFVLHPTAR